MASAQLSEFAAEANETLERLGRDLLTLDGRRGHEPDPELLNGIFRSAHSLKGLAGLFGVERVATLAHHAEDVLDALRLGKARLSDALLDALLECVEVLNALVRDALLGIAEGDPTGLAARRLGDRLTSLAIGPAEPARDVLDEVGISSTIRAVLTEYEEHRLRDSLRRGRGLWNVRVVFSLDDFDTRLAELNGALRKGGELISTLPSSVPVSAGRIGFELLVSGLDAPVLDPAWEASVSVVVAARTPLPPVQELSVMASRGSGDSLLTPLPLGADPVSLRALTQTVRVDIARLDGLMNTVGELLVVRNAFTRLADAARQPGVPRALAQSIERQARSLERKLEELQKGLLEVRMVPLRQVFDKLARLMRRLVKESGKSVSFEVLGADVELDKLIVDELSDPLMHLLRNALDHGVELPEARLAAGKPKLAKIGLRADQQGNHVRIEVSDDGEGMDERRIQLVAVSRGVVSAAQAQSMERRELLNLVFLPGFSTRDDVSELSGRGVGLDVVKTNLARLSGLIDIDSRRGEGTRFLLTLPLTLAIIRALMVRAGSELYAVPLNTVLEIVSVRPSELRSIERREVVEVRGQMLPFVRLAHVFELEAKPVDRHFVVVVGLAQQRIGLGVDGLEGQQDIVSKPLSGRLRSLAGIAGAAELGDRRAVLVLDVAALIDEVARAPVELQA